MISKVTSLHGKLDIGIQATGWGYLSPFLESTEEDLVKIMNLQFKGPYQFFQACIPAMSDGGNIIQISSATATIMLDNHAAYMGTKAGIDHVIRTIANDEQLDILIVECGGTVGDIESLPFLEALRQVKVEEGPENVIFVHVTLAPSLDVVGEQKTKPTQHSVQELRRIGIQPDLLCIRCSAPLEEKTKQ